MVGFTVAANILMKKSAMESGGADSWLAAMVSWKLAAALSCFAAGVLLYAVLLRWLPLSVAQCFAAAQFVGVILASMLILSEPIATGQWIGIALIALGIIVVGLTSPTV